MLQDHPRPNPDDLLAQLQSEEQSQTRGNLKIFLGYVAGVGKTYSMLEAARQRQAEGVDVVVGYVETHHRAETEALLGGLEVLPRKQIEYRGIVLTEMDVDAVLARRPQLVLVDELAHTNAPGARHTKRYHDVLELLDAGIDVYTTLNVQHLESLTDVVAQITGVTIRETVPDRVLDEASEIELVDLPPDELLQRLREGKVYVPEQAARAIERFFRKGNLTALREMAMRRAAERVDHQMRSYMETRAIPGPWAATERLLVCLSANTLGERLIRAGRRLADELNAEWFVLHVESMEQHKLPQAQQDRLAKNLRLAEELGARVLTTQAARVIPAILEVAHKYNATKLLAGKPLRPRWQELLRGSTVDQLIRQSGQIDVYVISGDPNQRPLITPREWIHSPYQSYLEALGLVILTTAVCRLISPFIQPTNLVMLYLLAVVVAGIYLGRGPSILTSLLSVLAFDFFFVPPHLTFAVTDTEYLLTFFGLLIVGLVISQLAARMREQADAARQRAGETAILNSLSRDLAVAPDLDSIMHAIVENVSQTFARQVAVLLPAGNANRLEPYATSPDFELDESEIAVATWAFEHKQAAGRGTDTLPAAQVRYIPLLTPRGIIGVMGIGPGEATGMLAPEQRRLLESFASLAAVAIERAQLAQAAQEKDVLAATEKLQTALLNSISHDLRTPLVSITGALSSLEEDGKALDDRTRHSLVANARTEADRLNRLVDNLLDMTRLEAGAIHIHRQLSDVQDVIGVALEQSHAALARHPLTVQVPPDLPLVPLDPQLMVQVLTNLLDNASKYSAPDTPIEISAQRIRDAVEVRVADRGIGIPPADLDRVFDKFYRVKHPENISGTGMGLSICRGIVEAHGGAIHAVPRDGGGTILAFTLPLTRVAEQHRPDRMAHA